MRRRRDTIRELQADPRIYGHCCHCEESFPLRRALLFYADEPIPPDVREKIDEWRSDLSERKLKLRERRRRARKGVEQQAIDVNLGKILEKIAPVFGGFGFNPRDCRHLSDPIDYVIFNGLSLRKEVESLVFVDEIGTRVGDTWGLVQEARTRRVGIRNETALRYTVPPEVWEGGVHVAEWVERITR